MVTGLEVLHEKPDPCMAAETTVTYAALFLKEMSHMESTVFSRQCQQGRRRP